MSATLVDDAALVKEFGANGESVLTPIKPKIGGDVGERLIVRPSLIDPKIDEITTTQLMKQVRNDHSPNVVVLVPSRRRSGIWKSDDSMHVPGVDIGTVISRLSTSTGNLAVIANRYDGIDLPDEACRVLVIDNLPREQRLSKLVESTARLHSPILKRQIAQKIEQGMGRGVRSNGDYCLVILAGKDLLTFMADINNQQFFTEDTKRQIEIGKEITTILREQPTSPNPYQAILALVGQFMNRDPGWQQFYLNRFQDVQPAQDLDESYMSIANAELEAWKWASRDRYDQAAEIIEKLIDDNKDMSDADRGWYLQLQAEYLYHIDQTVAIEKQRKAHETNTGVLKPPGGVSYRKIQAKQSGQAANVIEWIRQWNEPNALVLSAAAIVENLSFGVSSEAFEKGLDELARVIGFASHRPDHEMSKGPDVLWRMVDGHYLIFEAKNQVKVDRPKIFKNEAEQLGHHVTWFIQEYPGETYTPVLIHPSETLADDAYLEEGTVVIRQSELQNLAESVRQFVGVLASKPSGQWTTAEISNHLQTYRLRPSDFLNRPLGKKPTRRRR